MISKVKLVSAVLIAAAALATPAMARERHIVRHHVVNEAAAPYYNNYAGGYGYGGYGYSCVPAPRVGAFATQPWTNVTPCEPWSGY
jgi:hypothetical protein